MSSEMITIPSPPQKETNVKLKFKRADRDYQVKKVFISNQKKYDLLNLEIDFLVNIDKINKKTEGEDDMLDQAYEPKKNSRLSCQIQVSDDIEGLEVYLPEKQV